MKKRYLINLGLLIFLFCSSWGKIVFDQYDDWRYFVRHLMNQYQRPVTMLEIAAHEETLSFSLMKKYQNTTFVMLDWGDDARQLQAQCMLKRPDNVVLLGDSLSVHDLKLLSECEHFDIVVVHCLDRSGIPVRSAMPALLNMGDFIIFTTACQPLELPANREKYNLGSCCLCVMEKQYLERIAWVKNRAPKRDFKIKSDFLTKKLFKRWTLTGTPWQRGINLYTFVSTDGLYPTFEDIARQIAGFSAVNHNDIWLGNMIIQGKKVRLIDFDDKRRNADPKQHIDRCLKQLAERSASNGT